MSEREYDLIVVGAGPAGSSAAYAAAKNGIRVALLEKEENVAQTVRTSGVTWIDYAKEFGIPEDCYNPIRTYNFCSPKNNVSISDNKPKAAVLDVRKTYRFLAEQAKKSGAELFVSTNVTDVITESGKVVGVNVSSSNNEMIFRASMIIDASGFQSAVSKSLGLVKQWERFGVGAEYEAEVENIKSDTWWLMVGQMYSPAGYAWIFPLGKNLVRIGVGIGKPESDVDPTQRLDELIEREGIRYAIKYGRVAGDVASKAIKSGDTSENALQYYEETWKKEIESKIKSAHKVQDKWLKLSDDDWDKEIGIISNLTADEFLDFVRADFTISKMVKLATHHPMLAVRQFFNIVKGA